MPRKDNKPYVRWDVRKRIESAEAMRKESLETNPKPKSKATLLCQTCGVEIPPRRKFCSRSCSGKSSIRINLDWEQAVAAKLSQDGWTVFRPNVCCDRMGIKDGRLYFLEFKPKGKTELRYFQKIVQKMSPHNFRVVIGELDPENLSEVGTLKVLGGGRESTRSPRLPRMKLSNPSRYTSRFAGVSKSKGKSKWVAKLCINREIVYEHYFETEEDAARAYDAELERHYGVRVNFL